MAELPSAAARRQDMGNLIERVKERVNSARKYLLVEVPVEYWTTDMEALAAEVDRAVKDLDHEVAKAVARMEIAKAEAVIASWKGVLDD